MENFTSDIFSMCYTAKTNWLLTTEWLPWLQTSCGYESFTLVLETNWRRQPEKQVPNVQATLLSPSYTTLKPSEDLKGSLYKCTSELQ